MVRKHGGAGMDGTGRNPWAARFDRAARRERLRMLAVEALRAVEAGPLMTWDALAVKLNRRKVLSPLGRRWNGRSVWGFVRTHLAVTGEALVPGMGYSGRRSRVRALERGREAYLVRRRRAQAERALAVRRHCASARTYGEGAGLLNAAGVRTKSGEWTAQRLAEFVRNYRKTFNEVLMPLVMQQGAGKRR